MANFQKIALLTACLFVWLVLGWVILKGYAIGLWFLYAGLVGAIPFLLLNGVHGDAEGVNGVVGGFLFVLTNAAVYYGAVAFFLKLKRSRQKRASSFVPDSN